MTEGPGSAETIEGVTDASPPETQPARGPQPRPLWTFFLTPAAVILGALAIAGAVRWNGVDGDEEAPRAASVVVQATMAPTVGNQAQGASLQDTFVGYAKEQGLDTMRFAACLTDQGTTATINKHLQRGVALGVNGTPTFVINNKVLIGAQPTEIFQEIIDAELKGSPANLDGYSDRVKTLAAQGRFSIIPNPPDTSDAPVEGNRGAKVMVAEFSDFQCPFCKRWTDTTLAAIRTYVGRGDVALAFLHFPIEQIHANATEASTAAACAGEQGKFWQMHDLLFARQQQWERLQ